MRYRKVFTVDDLSDRAYYKVPVQEGGALNANYRQSEALAILCNKLGQQGLEYGKDFYWEDTNWDGVVLTFNCKEDICVTKLKL
jgi:hypothetical protein|tara:strand:- start:731 stop:982 length:252 start_codon:yes stop_codon:yes gene_type:complete